MEVAKAIKDKLRREATGSEENISGFTQGSGRQWVENNICTG